MSIRWQAVAGADSKTGGTADSVEEALEAARSVYRDGTVRLFEDDVEVIRETSVLDEGTNAWVWRREELP